ncbi:DNA polymerase/3'-5' exonuclease PolX [Luteolibacter sp. SL250]|uniref:DNA polymerase/3'-5' exonuclease PolX n=1 Tax=Luteolibacter sp. SL250 TaxID=2995170 RepID=UPI00226E3EBF|nr:DNA polymerase/3'-5' exonuclease PolX [Luteolibacter sp. SL250]WAC17999.1 DNA polymerase/3'-5' exonuclease PolX [Luteolibacter sp. SL250]
MPATRENLAEVLDEIALLLELKGENPFKVRAYRQGAEAVRGFDGDIVQLATDNELTGIKGIGDALRDKLHELAATGTLQFHQKLRAEFPAGLFELFDLQGLGPKKIKVLHETLGVGSVADLKALCESGTVARLPGFGEKTQTKILEAIALRSTVADTFLLGSINPLVEEILELLRMHPEVTRVAVAGSFRRGKETVHDIDFLVATKEPALVCEDFTTLPQMESIIACGDTKTSIRLKNGIQADLRAVSNKQFPFALQYFSGSKEHNVAIRSLALKKGLSLNEYGFTAVNSDAPAAIPEVNEEGDIYEALGLQFIPPELRENRGEIEAAAERTLPRLIQLENLRGTFHNHTTASDGHNTLEEMAEEAIDLGLQYLGIADHSKSSFQANGLDEIRLLEQIARIKELNAGWEHFRLFSGTEVDILKDGSLDFDDSILSKLDYCVASVHSVFNLDEDTMTRRICRAMENEHVTMLGHVTGRLLLRRDEYKVNHAKIIDCAAETRTIIELNCSPKRMDMDWRWWKKARDKGVLCSINPDAHSTARIHHIGLGVRIARKGWLRREDVLNTRPVKEVEAFLRTPKSER